MITAYLTGNFGNNLFGIVSSLGIAKTLNYEWGVNPRPEYDYHNGMIQTDFLDINYGKFPDNIQHEYTERCIRHNHDGDNTDIRTFDKNVYSIQDNTRLLGGVWQSYRYFSNLNLFDLLKIKQNTIDETNNILKSHNIELDDDTCLINFRGGEYRNYSRLIVDAKYYHDAIKHMKRINEKMKFVIITDDIHTANSFLPGIPAYHFSIAVDYTMINQARYLILSNSSFPVFAALTNKVIMKTIAPKYWARHNVSTGYWATSQNIYPGFTYLDRDGKHFGFLECDYECEQWMKNNGYGEFI